MKKNITMKVLMETMKKLNQEGWKDWEDPRTGNRLVDTDPVTGQSRPPKGSAFLSFVKNQNIDPEDRTSLDDPEVARATFQNLGSRSGNQDDQLDLEGPFQPKDDDKKDYIPGTGNLDLQGDEDFTTVGGGGKRKVSEIDFGGPGDETTTMAYNDEDTVPDGASTTEMVDALSDQVIAQLDNAGVLPLDISQEDAKDKVEDALMSVLKDMDATDLFDRS
jgi:hypothetical protein